MELTDNEVIILYEWIVRNGWIDRDWKNGEKLKELVDKIRDESIRLEYHF